MDATPLAQTDAAIWHFFNFSIGGRRYLGISNFGSAFDSYMTVKLCPDPLSFAGAVRENPILTNYIYMHNIAQIGIYYNRAESADGSTTLTWKDVVVTIVR